MDKLRIQKKYNRYIFMLFAMIFLGLFISLSSQRTVQAANKSTLEFKNVEHNPWNILKNDKDKINTAKVSKILSLSYLLRTWTIWACIVYIVYYLVRIAFPAKPSDIDEAKTGIVHKLIIVICVSGFATILNAIKLILDTSAGYPAFTI